MYDCDYGCGYDCGPRLVRARVHVHGTGIRSKWATAPRTPPADRHAGGHNSDAWGSGSAQTVAIWGSVASNGCGGWRVDRKQHQWHGCSVQRRDTGMDAGASVDSTSLGGLYLNALHAGILLRHDTK